MNTVEFARNLKRSFDLADKNGVIVITRKGKVYELRKVAE